MKSSLPQPKLSLPPASRTSRSPLAPIGLGHPSNLPVSGLNSNANQTIKKAKPRMSTRPSDTALPMLHVSNSDPFISSPHTGQAHNELKTILADPPRRRASTSAAEVLHVPNIVRSVSAPVPVGNSHRQETKNEDVQDSKNTEDKNAQEIAALTALITEMSATLSSTNTRLTELHNAVADIRGRQVSAADVLDSIKMVIEYFQAARNEDRKWIADAVDNSLAAVDSGVTRLLEAQNATISLLRQEVMQIGGRVEQQDTALVEVTNARLARLEEFLVGENRRLSETNACLETRVNAAAAEITALRQELAAVKESRGPLSVTAEPCAATTAPPENHLRSPPGVTIVPPSPRKIRHKRTPSSPIVPGMYPRVSALRREAMEEAAEVNKLSKVTFHTPPVSPQKEDASPADAHVPSIPALVPQSPFAFRFK